MLENVRDDPRDLQGRRRTGRVRGRARGLTGENGAYGGRRLRRLHRTPPCTHRAAAPGYWATSSRPRWTC
ncbi:hypothetical protein QJS66_02885 [Kocuria rhizophila]|nr:hypothetical protein QJS66_02885 [Kocuria rhizophila]